MNSKFLWVLLIGTACALSSFNQPDPRPTPPSPASIWADSVFAQMSLEERIGQLVMVRAYSNKGSEHIEEIESLIRDQHVGGVLFFQGMPEQQALLTNQYQSLTKRVPLLVGMDAEWGLGMRLRKSTISFPRQLMLGAISDNRLMYDLGAEIATHCKRLGVHLNLAPVVDVNNNAANPVINNRSFGEDRYNVAVKSYMYMKGMQDQQVLACAKHFPGHGDTNMDSHYDLPVIEHDRNRLDSIELFPFKVLAEQGIGSVMTAHLQVPSLDSTANMPTSLSRSVVTGILREQYRFDGLIITDGLDMDGVTKHHEYGALEAQALRAGNDILLIPHDVPLAIETILAQIKNGQLDSLEVFASVKRVLRTKHELGLTSFTPIALENLREDLNQPEAIALKNKLTEQALTVVQNQGDLLPLQRLDTLNVATIAIGAPTKTAFQRTVDRYIKAQHVNLTKDISRRQKDKTLKLVKNEDLIIVSLHNIRSYPKNGKYGISQASIDFIQELAAEKNVVLAFLGNPYALEPFANLRHIVLGYNEEIVTQERLAQGLFGAFAMTGRLPVTIAPNLPVNSGVSTTSLYRLGAATPEEVGMNASALQKIDSLALVAIQKKATPGCVVLVAKNGRVVYEKSYGHHTYDNRRPTQITDLYDLASITKIAATTISVMKLAETGQLKLTDTLGGLWPQLDTTNKSPLVLQDLMTHTAGLRAWIPFYEKTLDRRKQPDDEFYRRKSSGKYGIQVTDNLYLLSTYRDSIWQKIWDSSLRSDNRYVYSDLGFYLLAGLVEEKSGLTIDQFAMANFYRPMGLRTTTYNPLTRFSANKIPPTERDRYFRYQTVQGHVHDMGAAMLGGVSGHAGLFSNAHDLAALMQMLLNKGYYGGERFLEEKTVEQFTKRCPDCLRRGIGFDMKQLDPDIVLNMSSLASERTFGHLGFTGTCVWVDPDEELIYIFLSNRTYPSMKNNKLGKLNTRPLIHRAIYEAID
ncbi:MAG: glycoside hydrolase family 3 N-terminal domain-containing protein [Bacteroidota bacterium]